MSIRKRLLNVAKAELKSAGRKIGDLFDGSGDEDEKRVDEELKRMEAEEKSGTGSGSQRGKKQASSGGSKAGGESAQIRKYYANLELPIGASLEEVKASYRRMMRRYHPDLHQADGEKAQVATRLAQELRVAYDGLVAHLEPRKRG